MKTISDALNAHLSGANPLTLAYLWKIKRVDGTILGFTTHDQDIPYTDGDLDTVTYLHSTGFTNSAAQSKSDTSVDNIEVTGFLDSEALTGSDIRASLYDECAIQIRIVNWADLTMGDLYLRSGTVGEIKMINGQFTAEIRGLTYFLSTILGDLYGPICRAQFGSGKNGIDMNSQWLCQVDVTAYRQTGSVGTSLDAVSIVPAGTLLMVGSPTPAAAAGAGWFDDGFIQFTSGVLAGQSFEIKTWDGGTLKLYLPLPAVPSAADDFIIEPGCNHLVFDCNGKFQNIVNFRGEQFIPGMDSYLQTPDSL